MIPTSPTCLTQQTEQALLDLFQFSSAEVVDWHIATERIPGVLQSNICDRLSDALRLSPASIAHSIQQRLSSLGYKVESDSRGYLFVDYCEPQSLGGPAAVAIYIQPPPTKNLTLYYSKLLSQVAVQLESLGALSTPFTLLIPRASGGLHCIEEKDTEAYLGSEGLLRLLELLLAESHLPKVCDLDGIVGLSKRWMVLWLSTELLSQSGVGAKLLSLRRQLLSESAIVFNSVALKGDPQVGIGRQFLTNLSSSGLKACLYLAQLKHTLDLDWDTPALENSHNLLWLLSLPIENIARMLDLSGEPRAPLYEHEIACLLTHAPSMWKRTALRGDVDGPLFLLKDLGLRLQKSLNCRKSQGLLSTNILTSFPAKISSIIEGF